MVVHIDLVEEVVEEEMHPDNSFKMNMMGILGDTHNDLSVGYLTHLCLLKGMAYCPWWSLLSILHLMCLTVWVRLILYVQEVRISRPLSQPLK